MFHLFINISFLPDVQKLNLTNFRKMSNSVITLLGLNLNHIWDFSPSCGFSQLILSSREEEETELVQCSCGPAWTGTTPSPACPSSILFSYIGRPWVVCLSSQALQEGPLLDTQLLAFQEKPRDCSGHLLPAHTSSTISSVPPLPPP